MNERRADYRVGEGLEGIGVTLTLPGGEEVGSRLLNLSARGAAVVISISASAAGSLPAGMAVQVAFSIPGLKPLTDFLGIIRHERDMGDERVVGLEIADWQRLYGVLPSRLFAIFNRRRHVRVSVAGDPPVQASVRMQGDTARVGRVADISASGCALLFGLGKAPSVGDEICLSFQLPSIGCPYHLGGSVRATSDVGQATRVGVEFRKSRLPGFIEQEQSITEFVMDRSDQQSREEDPRNRGLGSA